MRIYLLLFFFSIASSGFSQGEEKRVFKKFRVDTGLGLGRFVGEEDPSYQLSKSGFAMHIEPRYNLSDFQGIGLKIIGSVYMQEYGTNHFTILANYTYSYFGKQVPERMEKSLAVVAGAGIGIGSGPTRLKSDSVPNPFRALSLAIVPRIGI